MSLEIALASGLGSFIGFVSAWLVRGWIDRVAFGRMLDEFDLEMERFADEYVEKKLKGVS